MQSSAQSFLLCTQVSNVGRSTVYLRKLLRFLSGLPGQETHACHDSDHLHGSFKLGLLFVGEATIERPLR